MWISVTDEFNVPTTINTDNIAFYTRDVVSDGRALIYFATSNTGLMSIVVRINYEDLSLLLTGDKLTKLVKLGVSDD